jgi:hypothetical protein
MSAFDTSVNNILKQYVFENLPAPDNTVSQISLADFDEKYKTEMELLAKKLQDENQMKEDDAKALARHTILSDLANQGVTIKV